MVHRGKYTLIVKRLWFREGENRQKKKEARGWPHFGERELSCGMNARAGHTKQAIERGGRAGGRDGMGTMVVWAEGICDMSSGSPLFFSLLSLFHSNKQTNQEKQRQ